MLAIRCRVNGLKVGDQKAISPKKKKNLKNRTEGQKEFHSKMIYKTIQYQE